MALLRTVVDSIIGAPERFVHAAAVALLFVLTAGAYVIVRDWRAAQSPRLSSAMREVFPRALYRNPTARADFWNYVLAYTLWLPLIAVYLAVVGAGLSADILSDLIVSQFGKRPPVLSNETAMIVAQASALFLGGELGIYLTHLMLHKIPVLWALHRVHHSAESLNFFTRFRDHPLDLMFLLPGRVIGGGLIGGILLFATGATLNTSAVAVVAVIGLMMPFGPDLWRHCHIPLSFGPLDRIFNSPVMHQIHHSAEPRHHDKNLGGELLIFDWIFGTLYIPEKNEDYRWGLNDAELGSNNPHLTLREFYLEPFVYAWRIITGRPRRVPFGTQEAAKQSSET